MYSRVHLPTVVGSTGVGDYFSQYKYWSGLGWVHRTLKEDVLPSRNEVNPSSEGTTGVVDVGIVEGGSGRTRVPGPQVRRGSVVEWNKSVPAPAGSPRLTPTLVVSGLLLREGRGVGSRRQSPTTVPRCRGTYEVSLELGGKV